MEPVSGFEPLTRALRMRCSTTELHRQEWEGKVLEGRLMSRGAWLQPARVDAPSQPDLLQQPEVTELDSIPRFDLFRLLSGS
jgi:hypothetical protein